MFLDLYTVRPLLQDVREVGHERGGLDSGTNYRRLEG